jgi:hypothetical protein
VTTPTPPKRPASALGRGAARRAAASAAANGTRSPIERYSRLLVYAIAALAIVVVGLFFFLQSSTPAYACATEWTAPQTAAPQPDATPRLGFVQDDLGRDHVSPGTAITYALCPPASGKHLNVTGEGPIKPGVFKPSDDTFPQGWIHNLEHGGLVVLYRCSSEACPEYQEAAFQAFYDSFPDSPICHTPKGAIGPIVARFDQMQYPFAALLWGQVLPLDSFDTARILAYWDQQGERSNPEKFCAAPSPTPAGS